MLESATTFDEGLSPAARTVRESGVLRVVISGNWTLGALDAIAGVLDGLGEIKRETRAVEIDLSDLRRLDTAGALALVTLRNGIGEETRPS